MLIKLKLIVNKLFKLTLTIRKDKPPISFRRR